MYNIVNIYLFMLKQFIYIVQIAESMFDIFVVPGGKIGLANIATLLGIFIFGGANGTVIAFLRALLGCILYGGVPAMPYSISGAV